jgi:hypothetical protein
MKRTLTSILFVLLAAVCIHAQAVELDSLINAQTWPDNNGKHINAHGGNIIKYGEKYYWYGENRPLRGFTTEVGVEVFSSTDLVNWTDEGVALAVSEEKGADIERGCIMERPKVVYNEKTGKFVMLFHLELKGRGYEAARVGFAVSDSPVGPFKFIRSLRPNAGIWPADFSKKDIKAAKKLDPEQYKEWWTPEWRKAVKTGLLLARDVPGGQMSRDMTVYIDDDGKAYHIYSVEENLTLNVAELTDDFLDYTGKYTRIAPGGQNEAPTILKRNGKYWLIASGCTGWDPNKARMFWSISIWGPWTQVETPFVGDGPTMEVRTRRGTESKTWSADKTFGTQGTYIMKLGEDKFVFMADMWNPRSLALSRHIWLPIAFKADGTPVISWQDKAPSLR